MTKLLLGLFCTIWGSVMLATPVLASSLFVNVIAYLPIEHDGGWTDPVQNAEFGLYYNGIRIAYGRTGRNGTVDIPLPESVVDINNADVRLISSTHTSNQTRVPLSEFMFSSFSNDYSYRWTFNRSGTEPAPPPSTVGNLTVIGGANPQVVLNGAAIQGASAVIVDGTTLVPVRVISENLGATVTWDGAARQVGVEVSSGDVVRLTIGSTAVVGKDTALLQAPVIINDLTYVPLRFIGELLGLKVGFQPAP